MSTVAVIGMGAMGSAVARVLHEGGNAVVTSVEGRGPSTIARAESSGAIIMESRDRLVESADVVLSIVPPAKAQEIAGDIATAARRSGRTGLIYVDYNAVAPATVRAIADTMASVGANFADGCIIGQPPGGDWRPAMPLCGPATASVVEILGQHLDVRVIDGPPGQASALKMCWAALTKVTSALYLELLVAAERLGVSDELRTQMNSGATLHLDIMNAWMPRIPPKAGRWVGEMHEIAATFDAVGLSTLIPTGAADLFRMVADAADRIEESSDVPTIVSHLV
jgi:3-hydroxyisobutyrate dehydrogenase-like beta-hydroxyacid dehydrogenase